VENFKQFRQQQLPLDLVDVNLSITKGHQLGVFHKVFLKIEKPIICFASPKAKKCCQLLVASTFVFLQ
jgi:hypothetical protein